MKDRLFVIFDEFNQSRWGSLWSYRDTLAAVIFYFNFENKIIYLGVSPHQLPLTSTSTKVSSHIQIDLFDMSWMPPHFSPFHSHTRT